MGDNNLIRGKVTQSQGGLVVIEDEHIKVSVRPGDQAAPAVGEQALVSIRAAAVEVGETSDAAAAGNSARCEIVFVEFLGDLVKLHLTVGGERMLAKVPGERYPDFRGREGQTILISWKEEDVQLLDS
jgi:ABC-type Fe3+/spermidine/putrescine transport system ATPase subunit